jgi:broad specificity phosphatase PhoE
MVGFSRLVGLTAGPERLVLVRHAESVGNLADRQARDSGADRLDLTARDADVELSDTGERQADALRRWVADLGADDRPDLVLSSPYRRALDTAVRAMAGTGIEVVTDERLRERDLGVFDGLTGKGIRSAYPDEAERREKLGKFYYQPPQGESWADVVLRVRSLLADLRVGFEGAHVWVFSHQAVIMSTRYVLEALTESELLEIDAETRPPNVSLTTYARQGDHLELAGFADTSVLDAMDAEVTAERGASQ